MGKTTAIGRALSGGSMKIIVFVLSLFFTTLAWAQVNAKTQRCSTKDASALDQILVQSELNYRRSQRNYLPLHFRTTAPITIPVYVHVISKGETFEEGYISREKMEEQIGVLNKNFASMKVQFELHGIDYTKNEAWFSSSFELEEEYKNLLHVGDGKTLNLYSVEGVDILGWATFPWDYKKQPKMDGVVISFKTLPGGPLAEYNMGHTAVHEVGHWLGLFHTFQGGCTGKGDRVEDTPAEAAPTFGCPKGAIDSCPQHPGLDPYRNFMDYSDDICLDEFTSGQMERIHDIFNSYRL